MKYLKYFLSFGCVVLTVQAVASVPDETACFVRGLSQKVSCFTLEVPKNYNEAELASRKINVIQVKARSANNNPPLFVLAGGPGQAAGEMTAYVNSAFKQVLKQHDIIFVDQRGSGKSLPLGCETSKLVTVVEIEAAIKQCKNDVLPYMAELTTETYVHDLEQVRQHLGVDTISLWGGSYGTFVAQAYASYYPQHVNVLLLDAVLALTGNPLVNGGPYAENSLQRLYQICQQDSRCQQRFGNWPAQLVALKNQFEQTPVPLNAKQMLGGDDLVHLVRSALYSPEMAARLPLAIEQAVAGDMAIFNALSQATTGAASDTMYLGLTIGVLCQEHVFVGQGELAAELGKDTFVGASYYTLWADICGQETPQKTVQVKIPKALTMPTLLISGNLDPITPEQSAEQALRYITKSTHLVIPNAGHTNSSRGCMPDLINEFLLTQHIIDSSCVLDNKFPPFAL